MACSGYAGTKSSKHPQQQESECRLSSLKTATLFELLVTRKTTLHFSRRAIYLRAHDAELCPHVSCCLKAPCSKNLGLGSTLLKQHIILLTSDKYQRIPATQIGSICCWRRVYHVERMLILMRPNELSAVHTEDSRARPVSHLRLQTKFWAHDTSSSVMK